MQFTEDVTQYNDQYNTSEVVWTCWLWGEYWLRQQACSSRSPH